MRLSGSGRPDRWVQQRVSFFGAEIAGQYTREFAGSRFRMAEFLRRPCSAARCLRDQPRVACSLYGVKAHRRQRVHRQPGVWPRRTASADAPVSAESGRGRAGIGDVFRKPPALRDLSWGMTDADILGSAGSIRSNACGAATSMLVAAEEQRRRGPRRPRRCAAGMKPTAASASLSRVARGSR